MNHASAAEAASCQMNHASAAEEVSDYLQEADRSIQAVQEDLLNPSVHSQFVLQKLCLKNR